ncbi:MAG: VOC family protein [Tepidiformaceae bacterium]
MNVKRIDHVGIAVKDLDAALATYGRNFDLKADAARGGEVPAFAIKNAFVPIGGTDLEFFQPTTAEGPVAKFVAERGEGLYMISLEVDDLTSAISELRSLGARVGDPVNGLAFVSMRATHGVNLQLVQRG